MDASGPNPLDRVLSCHSGPGSLSLHSEGEIRAERGTCSCLCGEGVPGAGGASASASAETLGFASGSFLRDSSIPRKKSLLLILCAPRRLLQSLSASVLGHLTGSVLPTLRAPRWLGPHAPLPPMMRQEEGARGEVVALRRPPTMASLFLPSPAFVLATFFLAPTQASGPAGCWEMHPV